MSEWEGLSRKEYLQKKEKYFSFLVEKISSILPDLEENIDHKEIGTQKPIKSFLEDMKAVMGQYLNQKLLGLLPMPLILQKLKPLLCGGLMLPRSRPKCSSF